MDFQITKPKVQVALLVFNLFVVLRGNAQITNDFSVGLKSKMEYLGLNSIDSTYLLFTIPQSTNGVEFDRYFANKINKQTLVVEDTFLFSQKKVNSAILWHGYLFKDNVGKHHLAGFDHQESDSLLTLSFYNLDSNLKKDSLVFTKSWNNRVSQQLGYANDELIVIYTNVRPPHDSLFIETYSLDGVLQNSRVYDGFSSTTGQMNVLIGLLTPKEHPVIPNAFILAHTTDTEIYIVNQSTLDTIRTYDIDTNNIYLASNGGYWTLHNNGIDVENDGVILSGTAHMKHDTSSMSSVFDFQYFEFKQFWDGTYEIRNFGPKDTDNRSYVNASNNDVSVIAGSIPFNDAAFNSQEQREVLLYLYDDFGKYDSIYLHGDKNHVPFNMLVEDNGDIFIAGMYTDAWTTDSSYVWLTKIPGIAVGMIEQEKINNHLFLFPNPTVERIQIKEVSKFLNGEYEIYSQTGVLVKQGTVTGQEIDVSAFIAGVYVLTVKSESGEQFNAIFVKE